MRKSASFIHALAAPEPIVAGHNISHDNNFDFAKVSTFAKSA